jgi:YggT family protein
MAVLSRRPAAHQALTGVLSERVRSLSLFGPIIWLIDTIIGLFLIVMIVRAVLSLLFMMDVITRRQPIAYQIYDFTERITEPVIRPIRRLVPPIGGLDLAFLLTFLLITVVRMYLGQLDRVLP